MAHVPERQLTRLDGVVIPSKLPEGQESFEPSETPKDRARDKTCPTCGQTDTMLDNTQSHFMTCVCRNGNPTKAHLDDNPNLVPRPHLVKQKHDDDLNEM